MDSVTLTLRFEKQKIEDFEHPYNKQSFSVIQLTIERTFIYTWQYP